jgi:hypothetical protein
MRRTIASSCHAPRALAIAQPSTESISAALYNRPRRVIVLLAGIIVLSIADLIVTLAYLNADRMMEANPIAAYLISTTQSAWALASFKALTVGICVALLYRVRHHVVAEAAAWFGMGVLTLMCIMWYSYSSHFDGAEDILLAQTLTQDVRLRLP